MREGYIDYIYALYENRRALYNHISYIGDRARVPRETERARPPSTSPLLSGS